MSKKLGRSTTQRMAIIKNQASELLWYGKIETTFERAKQVRSYAEKVLTLAINSYEDKVITEKTKTNLKGDSIKVKFENDGPKRLSARRKIMSKLIYLKFQREEDQSKADFVSKTKEIKYPLVEKLFREYAPKYAKRNQENGKGGGYTRVLKLGARRGDAAEMAIVELI